jgi:hypothetical protein
VNLTRPDTLWVSLYGQPTFLWFPAGTDTASLVSAIRPYLPTDLAKPRESRSSEELSADLAEAAAGEIPGPAPGQTHSIRLLVGLALVHSGETLPAFDLSLLKSGVGDPRFQMRGSIADNPRSDPAVTVVRTLYSRSTVRLDWYDRLDGVVCAEIYYAPATQHETIRRLNERFRLNYPLDIPVDVPALLLGLEAISAPVLLEHMIKRVEDPNLLVAYLNCLSILTNPNLAESLRPFIDHPSPVVRNSVIQMAAQKAPELLGEMQQLETDPELRELIAVIRGPAKPPAPAAPAGKHNRPGPPSTPAETGQSAPTPGAAGDTESAPRAAKKRSPEVESALKEALEKALGRSSTEPSSDAFIPLDPNPRADQAAIIADVAATFPSAAPVTVSQPEGAWGPWFHFGAVTVKTYILPMPIPPDHLEPAYEFSWLWQTAKDDLRAHAAMLTLSADSGRTRIDRMVALTMMASAFLGTCPQALGVLWDEAGHLVKGRVFRDFAAGQIPTQMPLFLWLGLPAWPNPDGTTSGYTVGLKQFGLVEIETTDAPLSVLELRQRFNKLAEILITREPEIRDGAIIARSENQTVRVSFGESQFGRGKRVMRLHHKTGAGAPTGVN